MEQETVNLLCFAVVQHYMISVLSLQDYWIHYYIDNREDYQRNVIE